LSATAPPETPLQGGEMQRRAQCDAAGDFECAGVASSLCYVLSRVIWTAGESFIPWRGYLVQRAELCGGRRARGLPT
jgi:hypothetical protein